MSIKFYTTNNLWRMKVLKSIVIYEKERKFHNEECLSQ